jgi:hypothetical protein
MIPSNQMQSLHYSTIYDQEILLSLVKEQSDEVGNEEVLETKADDLDREISEIKKKRTAEPVKSSKPKGSSSSLFKAWKKGRSNF